MKHVPVGGKWLAHEANPITRSNGVGGDGGAADSATNGNSKQDQPVAPLRRPMIERLSAESLAEIAGFLHLDVMHLVARYQEGACGGSSQQ